MPGILTESTEHCVGQEVGERELGETEEVRLRCCTEMATWLAVEVSSN